MVGASGASYIDDSSYDWYTDTDLAPALGDVYDITGALFYSYDLYRINPMFADIVTTGIAEAFIPQQLAIYPNPVTNNYFNIESDKKMVSVEVINVLGQTIFESSNTDMQTKTQIELDNRLCIIFVTVSIVGVINKSEKHSGVLGFVCGGF